jgi:hypothetical protein
VRGGGVPAVPECEGGRPPSMTVEYGLTEWDRALEALAAATVLLAHAASIARRHARTTPRFTRVLRRVSRGECTLRSRGSNVHQALGARGSGPPGPRQGGGWSADLGRDYSFCVNVRGVSDYGDEVRVDATQAEEATAAARRILEVVSDAMPPPMTQDEDTMKTCRRSSSTSGSECPAPAVRGDRSSDGPTSTAPTRAAPHRSWRPRRPPPLGWSRIR